MAYGIVPNAKVSIGNEWHRLVPHASGMLTGKAVQVVTETKCNRSHCSIEPHPLHGQFGPGVTPVCQPPSRTAPPCDPTLTPEADPTASPTPAHRSASARARIPAERPDRPRL